MRVSIVLLAVGTISCGSVQGTQLTKPACARMAPGIQEMAASAARTLSKVNPAADYFMVNDTEGKLHEAAVNAADAKSKLDAALKAYQIALEEYGYRLQLCGR